MDRIDSSARIVSLTPADGGSQIAVCCRTGQETKEYLLLAEEFADLRDLIFPSAVIDRETLAHLAECDGRCRAVMRGRSLLEYRSNSKKGLETKLRKKGFSGADARFAAARLAEEGLIDEERDAFREAERQIAAGRGRQRVVSALFAAGYSREAVASVSELLDSTDFSENCKRAIESKWGSLPTDPDGRRRAVAALFRMGFSSEDIKKAVHGLARRADR